MMTRRATFHTMGMKHSPTSATGTGWERTPVARDAEGGVGGRNQEVGSALPQACSEVRRGSICRWGTRS